MAECMTSGARTPATAAFVSAPMKACTDEAMPRRSGTMSSSIRVTASTDSDQPKENTDTGISARATCDAKTRQAKTLTPAEAPRSHPEVKPHPVSADNGWGSTFATRWLDPEQPERQR